LRRFISARSNGRRSPFNARFQWSGKNVTGSVAGSPDAARALFPGAALGVLLVCAGLLSATAWSATPDYSVVPKLQEVKEHSEAPDFTLASPDGRKVSLKDFRGKVVFLNFWATWCEACRDEMPAMEKLYREFKGKGLEIVGVNVKDKRPDALAFLKKYQISYPIIMDPDGEAGLLYGAFGMPITYLIDRKGVVQARLLGGADWYTPGARNLIKTLVEKK
jgi:DsbE subfamily thiol:disulfide oxidoreductase